MRETQKNTSSRGAERCRIAALAIATGAASFFATRLLLSQGHGERLGREGQRLVNTGRASQPSVRRPVESPRLADCMPGFVAELLRRDPRDVPEQDRACVWAFLRQCWGLRFERQSEWLLGADQALAWLCGAPEKREEILEGLIDLVGTQTLPEGLRECALHHLGGVRDGLPPTPEVWKVLERIVTLEPDRALAGTALVSLSRMNCKSGQLEWIRERVLQVARAEGGSVRVRVAALQIAGTLGFTEMEPLARAACVQSESAAEKIAAFEALGALGNEETLVWLRSLPSASEVWCQEIRAETLKRLNSASTHGESER